MATFLYEFVETQDLIWRLPDAIMPLPLHTSPMGWICIPIRRYSDGASVVNNIYQDSKHEITHQVDAAGRFCLHVLFLLFK